MNANELWTRVRAWFKGAAGLLLEMLKSLGRALRRGWERTRPYIARAGAWLRPRFAAARAWLAPRARRLGASLGARARAGWNRTSALTLWTARALRALARRMRRPLLVTARIALIAALLGGALLGIGSSFVHHTPPGTLAVRHVRWGGAGVIERDHGPGLHRTLPLRDTWHHLPAGTHLVSFASPPEGGSHPPLEVATREGEGAQAAVVVPYRIRPGSGWRLVADGLRADYPGRAVAICRRVLLEELATLSPTDFADPDARAGVERRALARLDTELGATHLEPLGVRIGSVFFNPTYEKKMLEKQLATQDELTQESLVLRKQEQRANQDALLELEDAEAALVRAFALRAEEQRDAHQMEMQEIARTSELYRARRQSETEVAVLELKNEGELALAAAADLRQILFDDGLKSAGGRLHVARAAAENLRFGKVTLDSNDPRVPSPLDLDGLVTLLMGKEKE